MSGYSLGCCALGEEGFGTGQDDTEHLVIQPTVEDDLGSDTSGAEFREAASPAAG